MTEPASGSAAFVLTGAAVGVLGPVIGPFVMLLFAAAMGSLLALTKRDNKEVPMKKWEGIVYMLVGMGIALSLSGLGVWLLEKFTSVPGNLALMPVSFFLAAGRDLLLVLAARAVDAAGTFFDALARRGGPAK